MIPNIITHYRISISTVYIHSHITNHTNSTSKLHAKNVHTTFLHIQSNKFSLILCLVFYFAGVVFALAAASAASLFSISAYLAENCPDNDLAALIHAKIITPKNPPK